MDRRNDNLKDASSATVKKEAHFRRFLNNKLLLSYFSMQKNPSNFLSSVAEHPVFYRTTFYDILPNNNSKLNTGKGENMKETNWESYLYRI